MADHEGPIVQPLFSISQSLDAYQQLNAQITDSPTAVGYPYQTPEEEVVGLGTGTEIINVDQTLLVTGVASATETLTQTMGATVWDVVTATNIFETAQSTTFANTASAINVITLSRSVTETGTSAATDEILLDIVATMTELAAASSEFVSLNIQGNVLLADSVAAVDYVTPGQTVLLEDVATAVSVETPVFTAVVAVDNTASATDEQTHWNVTVEELSFTITGSETLTFDGSVYSDLVIGTATVTDALWAKDFAAIAWVMNTQSGGITSYNNYGFTSLAFFNGVLYATSAEGLFEVNANDDAGRMISASWKTGFEDFGTEAKKRISDMYIGYTGTDLECDVETFDKQVYTYAMEPRDMTAPHNNRLKIGRGLSSRYWRFGFRNVSGADFQIQDIAVEAAVSKRRL